MVNIQYAQKDSFSRPALRGSVIQHLGIYVAEQKRPTTKQLKVKRYILEELKLQRGM